ncbi:PIR Superfamily Protein [Plasmodium ovale wallikeri]|uniref:PIR Superfamily Protein n=1 Tax=Plasmodium ovale wallikeri TaxID=864142 RepID=A0A1A9ASR9_PLAOA|nr:PIR Superfamily Protein [Plasmodium ovale wallikeri]
MSPELQTYNKLPNPYFVYEKVLDNYKSDAETPEIYGCNEFISKHVNDSKYGAIKTCSIAIKFLNHLKERNDPSYQEYGCKYMYYWLYVEALESKKSINNALDLYRELNLLYNREHDGDNKFDKYISKFNNNTYEKVKKLIHIYDVFNTFASQATPEDPYMKCTSDCIKLFTSHAEECRTVYEKDFCDELNLFREKYNFFIQRIRNCEGEEYFLPPIEGFDAVSKIIIPVSLIFVTSFILPFLYKFTAFGPWINRLISKKKYMSDNINEETVQLLNSYEMEGHNSRKNNYNIAYNLS